MMKKSILSLTMIAAMFSIKASAQLVSSLNISTGWNNVTSTTIPYIGKDDDWKIAGLTSPFVPFSSPYPYVALVQKPWYISTVLSPIILAGSGWISYNTNSMTVGPYDNTGGKIYYEYDFTTCKTDHITIQAKVLCDNAISNFYIDAVNTGFTMPATSSNWNPGSTINFTTTLPAGTHAIYVEVDNVATTQTNNPAGLDLAGTLKSPLGVLVDLDNFPGYQCNGNKMTPGVDNTDRVTELEQNAPNPFTGTTQIKYYISGLQPNTSIIVTDLSGRTLMTYPITTEGEGSITVGNQLAPGTYLYSLTVNGHVIDSKRMIMNK